MVVVLLILLLSYHNITFSYGSGNCIQSIDTVFFVEEELITTTYQSTDTICAGELININANVIGGTGNYLFNWSNNLSNSFNHLFIPDQTNTYILNVSDGCSENTVDSIFIFVYDEFNLNFITSDKKCFGEYGFAKVQTNSLDNISYKWNTNPSVYGDSIYALVNRDYFIEATNNVSNCVAIDTISILGYDNLSASFLLNNNECLSILNSEIQLIDQSIVNPNEISLISYWDFGDSESAPYIYSFNPIHTFYVKALGLFYEFNITIHERWNNTIIFQSDEIIITNNLIEGSSCDNNNYSSFYKMGSWDGNLFNGNKAQFGAYPYEISYKKLKDSKTTYHLGTISLVR